MDATAQTLSHLTRLLTMEMLRDERLKRLSDGVALSWPVHLDLLCASQRAHSFPYSLNLALAFNSVLPTCHPADLFLLSPDEDTGRAVTHAKGRAGNGWLKQDDIAVH